VQKNQQLLDKSSYSYVQFINALSSNRTKESYTFFLDSFLRFAKLGCDQLLELEPRKVQGILISYIIDMKEKQKQSPNSMKSKVAAVKTFFEMNDYMEINWRKARRYIGEFYRIAEDRPYRRGEIKLLVESAHSLRDKAIILLRAYPKTPPLL